MSIKNLTGQVFGKLTVGNRSEAGTHGHSQYECHCSCGTMVVIRTSHLVHGQRTSCGCGYDDLTGQVFGNLTVIGLHKKEPRPFGKGFRFLWECLCTCGQVSFPENTSLKGGTVSCGCSRRKQTYEVGMVFEDLRIKEQLVENGTKGTIIRYLCECSCGNTTILTGFEITTHKSCGCRMSHRNPLALKRKALVAEHIYPGAKFTYWTVLGESSYERFYGQQKHYYRLCACKCGRERLVHEMSLINGKSRSCGCKRGHKANTASTKKCGWVRRLPGNSGMIQGIHYQPQRNESGY